MELDLLFPNITLDEYLSRIVYANPEGKSALCNNDVNILRPVSTYLDTGYVYYFNNSLGLEWYIRMNRYLSACGVNIPSNYVLFYRIIIGEYKIPDYYHSQIVIVDMQKKEKTVYNVDHYKLIVRGRKFGIYSSDYYIHDNKLSSLYDSMKVFYYIKEINPKHSQTIDAINDHISDYFTKVVLPISFRC